MSSLAFFSIGSIMIAVSFPSGNVCLFLFVTWWDGHVDSFVEARRCKSLIDPASVSGDYAVPSTNQHIALNYRHVCPSAGG
jgi:hypothetical protein